MQSVATRVVATLVVTALIGLVIVGSLELRRSRSALQLELDQELSLATAGIRDVSGAMLAGNADTDDLAQMLRSMTAERYIAAGRIFGPQLPPVTFGPWGQLIDSVEPQPREVTTGGLDDQTISLDQHTRIHTQFAHAGEVYDLTLIVDGPAAYAEMRGAVLSRFALAGLFLCTMLLLGLLLLRRWLLAPIGRVVELARIQGEPADFQQLAGRSHGEIARLARTLARMLTRLDQTTRQLRQRQRDFADLYECAPTALVSVDLDGQITHANHRAAELLGAGSVDQIIGQPWGDFIYTGDQPRLQQAIDRLVTADATRCHLRACRGINLFDTAIEVRANRDEAGLLRSVRLSVLDVSETAASQRAVARESQQLSLAMDHLERAVMFVDPEGRIAACNQPMAQLLHVRPELVIGQTLNHEPFWDELGLAEPRTTIHRLQQIDADHRCPAQEHVTTRSGKYLFRGTPIRDGAGNHAGRLWVIEEATPHDHSRQLLAEQANQLQVLRQVGQALQTVNTVDELLGQAIEQVFEVMGVEAVGFAVRRDETDHARRSRQLIYRGATQTLLTPNAQLVDAIEAQLLPHTLAQGEMAYWSDLDLPSQWARAATAAGLTCLAVAPLHGGEENQGILWVARRGGERLSNHHLHLLETLAPLIAAHLHTTRVIERMYQLRLTDRATGLPNHDQLIQATTRQLAHAMEQYHLASLESDAANSPNALESSELDDGSQSVRERWPAMLVLRVDPLPEAPTHHGPKPQAYDEIMRAVSRDLRNLCRHGTLLARLEGPRFALLSPHTDPEAARRLAQRLQDGIQPGLHWPGPDAVPRPVTLSVGIACPDDEIVSPYQLLNTALHCLESDARVGRILNAAPTRLAS